MQALALTHAGWCPRKQQAMFAAHHAHDQSQMPRVHTRYDDEQNHDRCATRVGQYISSRIGGNVSMVTIDREQILLLEQRLRGIGISRRQFMRVTAAALAAPAAGSLLAACGGDDDDDDTATAPAAPTVAAPAAPTATTAAAAEPTATAGSSTAAEPTATTATAAAPTATTAAPAAATPTAAAAAPEMDAEQVFRVIGARQDPSSHDFNANLYSGGVAQMWMGLSTYDVDFLPAPGWAESWEPNDDASVWTYHLRPDNKGFSNGDPVTAETFVYSWQRLLLPETKAPYASILFDIKGAEDININGADPSTLGARAIDDWTLEVEMVGPRGVFPIIAGYVACVPTHPASVEAATSGGGSYSTDPADGEVISNGPWVITEWEHNQECVLERNPNYFDSDIKLERIEWIIAPAEQGMLPYEANEVDFALVPGADLPRIQSDSVMSKELEKWVEPLYWTLLPQVTVAPFDDIEVRRALQHSIDRDRINDLTNGGGDPAYCLMPPGTFGYFGAEFQELSDFNLDKVAEHVAASQYADGNWPEVTMILRNEAHLNSTIMAEDIAAQVQENMGLELTLQIMDVQAFRELQFSLTPQLIWIRWFHDYPDPNNAYFDGFYSNKDSGKRQAWGSDEYDDLVIKGKEEVDPEKRLDIYRRCEEILQTEVASIPIVYRNAYYVYKPWVQGVPISKQGFATPNGNIYLGMWDTVYIAGRE